MNEFAFIAERLAPLAAGWPGAVGLADDAATLDGQWVATTDTIVEGTHFFPEDPLDGVAAKAVLTAASDLVAKAARPAGYLLNLTLPRAWSDAEAALFCEGLAEAQTSLGAALIGGDTTRGGAALVVSVTFLGRSSGDTPRRDGARPGEAVYVSGPVGAGVLALNGMLRLREALGPVKGSADGAEAFPHFLRPAVDSRAIPIVAAFASASTDVSDGLLADVGHIAQASGVAMRVEAEAVPLAEGAEAYLAEADSANAARIELLTGGEDYVVAFTSPAPEDDVIAASVRAGLSVARIGRVEEGEGVVLFDAKGDIHKITRAGFTHF